MSSFARGGKNHLGNELHKDVKKYHELLAKKPLDIPKLQSFLGELESFLQANKEEISSQCKNNGWDATKELIRASENTDIFLKNPQGTESPLFQINDSIAHIHSYLINVNTTNP